MGARQNCRVTGAWCALWWLAWAAGGVGAAAAAVGDPAPGAAAPAGGSSPPRRIRGRRALLGGPGSGAPGALAGSPPADTSRRRRPPPRVLHDPDESLAPSPAPSPLPTPAPTALRRASGSGKKSDGAKTNRPQFIVSISLFAVGFAALVGFIVGPCVAYGECSRESVARVPLYDGRAKPRLALPGPPRKPDDLVRRKVSAPERTIYDIIEEEKEGAGAVLRDAATASSKV